MRLTRRVKITDAVFVSSTVDEEDYPVWNAATDYDLEDRVIRTTGVHRIFQNTVAGVDATPPEESAVSSSPKWVEVQPTNRWCVADDYVDIRATGTVSGTWVYAPGEVIDTVAVLGLDGNEVEVVMTNGGDEVFRQTQALVETDMSDGDNSYMFDPFRTIRLAKFTNLPPYGAAEVSITIIGPTWELGEIVMGVSSYIGRLIYGADAGYETYTRNVTNAFGRDRTTKRRTRGSMSGEVVIEDGDYDRVAELGREVDGEICLWEGTADDRFKMMTLLGMATQFRQTFPDYGHSKLRIAVLET